MAKPDSGHHSLREKDSVELITLASWIQNLYCKTVKASKFFSAQILKLDYYPMIEKPDSLIL